MAPGLVLGLTLALSGTALARGNVVVLPFSGPRGAAAAATIQRHLSLPTVSAGRFARAARGGFVVAARRLRVGAVVDGSLRRSGGRWVLRLRVRSGNGKTVGRTTTRLRGSRLDPGSARRAVRALRRLIARTSPPGGVRIARRRPRPRVRPRPAPQPIPQPQPPLRKPGFDDGQDVQRQDQGTATLGTPQPAKPTPAAPKAPKASDLGFEVGSGSGKPSEGSGDTDIVTPSGDGDSTGQDGGSADGGAPTDGSRPRWETIFSLATGVHVQYRSFAFNDPISPPAPAHYRSGLVAAIAVEGAIYPFATLTRSTLADFGIQARFDRVLFLKSQLPSGEQANTLAQTFEAGLVWRWNILAREESPTVRVGVGYGRQMFFILRDPPPLPNITYDYLDLALVGADWTFYTFKDWRIGASLDFRYLLVFSAGPIESADMNGYGKSNTGGIVGSGGAYVGYRGFFAKLNGFYRRYFFDFKGVCGLQKSCNRAGGALDVYLGATLAFGYEY